MKKLIYTLTALSFPLLGHSGWWSAPKIEDPECKEALQPYRATLRHIEPKGVGYNKGYTTAELFAGLFSWTDTVPFIDTRLHIFDNAKIAFNGGVGVRHLFNSFVIGANAYYDYRQTSKFHYNQAGLGLEALGKVWDVRLNGYLPVGKKQTKDHNWRFGYFSGHRLYLLQDNEFAMKGLSAEAGIHIKKMKNFSFYGAFGPYYFTGQGKNAIGGEARLSGTGWKFLKAEVSGSYDPVFHGIVQGQISLMHQFGPKIKRKAKKGVSCSRELWLRERSLQSVDRNEIVVVDKKTGKTPAIDPRTNAPFTFWFVNNTSHSAGTFESPYPELLSAQDNSKEYDIIYAYAGNGSTQGMEEGLILKDHQKFWGTGMGHPLLTTRGLIHIPSLASGMPKITYLAPPSASATLTLANDCDIAGIHFVHPGAAIVNLTSAIVGGTPSRTSGDLGIQDTSIHDNLIEGSYNESGIWLHNCFGNLTVQDNTLAKITPGLGSPPESIFYLTETVELPPVNLQIVNNQASDVIFLQFSSSNTDNFHALVASNQVEGAATSAIGISMDDPTTPSTGSDITITIEDNTLSGSAFAGVFMEVQYDNTSSILEDYSVIIDHNSISESAQEGIRCVLNANLPPLHVTIHNNTVLSSGDDAIQFTSGLDEMCVSVQKNTVIGTPSNGIAINAEGDGFSVATVNAFIDKNRVEKEFETTNEGILLASTGPGFGQVCAKVTNNTVINGVIYARPNTGVINIELPIEGNTPPTISGTYVPRDPGTCDCNN